MLQCNHLIKKYRSLTAVNDLSLKIEAGKTYALLGPNGSGKSTFMKIAAGLIQPTAGEISFEGHPVGVFSKAHIAYMPTEAYFYSYMTWEDAGHYYRDFYEDFQSSVYSRLLELFQLDPNQKISKMSSGMTAKGKIALALSRDAHLCLLDEPLNGIDIIARDQILETIRKSSSPKRAFVISSHLVDELESMADEVFFMKEGTLFLSGNRKKLEEETGKTLTELYKEIYRSCAV